MQIPPASGRKKRPKTRVTLIVRSHPTHLGISRNDVSIRATPSPPRTRWIMLKMSLLNSTRTSDIVVIGAGLIGLAIALELTDRGANVPVIDRGESLAGASTAAAGMLAANDPGNPPELRELSRMSAERYPAFLARLEALSGIAVPFQTNATIQYLHDGSTLRLAEHSLDPRQLAVAVR